MFNAKKCKSQGKLSFKRNYWSCVLAALILTFCVQGITISSSTDKIKNSETVRRITASIGLTYDEQQTEEDSKMSVNYPGTLLQILLLNVISVGCYKFFIDEALSEQSPSFDAVIKFFKDGTYTTKMLTMFLMNLFIALWSLLLVVPGIVKSYEYSMIPYILADYPELSRKEVFALSKKMTMGSKWNIFKFDLSFIGWWILGAVTFGIVNAFYVSPYYYASRTQVYLNLKQMQE